MKEYDKHMGKITDTKKNPLKQAIHSIDYLILLTQTLFARTYNLTKHKIQEGTAQNNKNNIVTTFGKNIYKNWDKCSLFLSQLSSVLYVRHVWCHFRAVYIGQLEAK